MNSGKVRLNSGILERRHSNWDEALHHFRRAREIDDTYCEPDYWIGASLLQQGTQVQLGLMVGHAGHAVLWVLYHAPTAKRMVEPMPWNQSGKCVTAAALRASQQVCSAEGQQQLHKTGCHCTWHSPASLLCHIQELEKALRCKYVAANALNALQQVYQLMGSEAKEKAASHQAWARILLKPELGRVVEACQLLEQVALEKVQLGGSYASAQGKIQCDTG